MPCLDEILFMELALQGLPPARAVEVDAHLDTCPECRQLVAHLLPRSGDGAEEASTPFPSALPSRPAPDAGRTPLPPGTAVGRYLVLEWLGAGGMGVVYAAFDPELDRKVALKLLRTAALGLEPEAGRAHLLREAQAMARVSHPHVVPVYDVGTFGEQVFLAMEYVEALTLRQWLRAAPRTWRQVRDVFVQAARGLAAAHAVGLVHGDVKPENLLVGGDGRVRVTDFGLARSTASVGTSGNVPRGVGGTPAYMAPEQRSGDGPADARSDQFSFCAALYEGLQGERPFAGSSVSELAAEVRAGRVRPVPQDTPVPRWLHRVVLRGLEVEPDRRHASMEALLAALLDDPVARRRRWWGWGAGLSLLVGAVGATHAVHAHRARACQSTAEHALAGIWDGPRRERVEAAFSSTGQPFAVEAWASVRRSLDAYTAGWVTARTVTCEAMQVRGEPSEAVRDPRMRCLDRRLAEVSALTQVLAQADADVVGRALRAVESLPSPARCADAAVLSAPAEPVDGASRERADALRLSLARARALGAAGRYAEGLAVLGPGAEAAGAAGDLAGQAEALLGLAELRDQAGDYRGAEEAVFASLRAAEAVPHDEVAARAWTLAVSLSGERFEQSALAHRWRERAEAAIARLGGDDVLLARLHGNVGRALYVQGRYGEAEARYRQALELLERTVGPRSLEVADILLKRCAALLALGHFEAALGLTRRALDLRERALGADHPEVGQALVELAMVRGYQGEHEDEERLASRGLEVLERALGPEHPSLSLALTAVASARFARGRERETLLPLLERALRLSESSMGPDGSRSAVLVANIATTLGRMGRLREAERHFTDALSRIERKQGPGHPLLVRPLLGLGEVLQQQGRLAEALRHLERAAAIQGAQPEDVCGLWGPSLLALGHAYLSLTRPREARGPLSRFVAGWEHARPVPKNAMAMGRFFLARALWDSGGDRTAALRLATEARSLLDEGTTPESSPLRRDVLAWLARRTARARP